MSINCTISNVRMDLLKSLMHQKTKLGPLRRHPLPSSVFVGINVGETWARPTSEVKYSFLRSSYVGHLIVHTLKGKMGLSK